MGLSCSTIDTHEFLSLGGALSVSGKVLGNSESCLRIGKTRGPKINGCTKAVRLLEIVQSRGRGREAFGPSSHLRRGVAARSRGAADGLSCASLPRSCTRTSRASWPCTARSSAARTTRPPWRTWTRLSSKSRWRVPRPAAPSRGPGPPGGFCGNTGHDPNFVRLLGWAGFPERSPFPSV